MLLIQKAFFLKTLIKCVISGDFVRSFR